MKVGAVMGSLFILSLLLFSTISVPVHAQTVQTVTPAVSTANPTLAALESTISTQQAKIELLEREQTFEAREREIAFRDINSQWKTIAAVGGIAILFLGWFGFSSVRDARLAMEKQVKSIEQNWEAQLQSTLDKAVYKLDLGNLPIYLPAGENLENIHRFLQQRKFAKVGFYENFEEVEHGVLIVSLKRKNEVQQAELLKTFTEFIQDHKPDISEMGFIVYAPGGIRVPGEVMESYDNLVTANYPATVVSSIFTVGRGLSAAAPEKEENSK